MNFLVNSRGQGLENLEAGEKFFERQVFIGTCAFRCEGATVLSDACDVVLRQWYSMTVSDTPSL